MFIQEDDLKLNDWQFSQRKYLPYKVKKTLAEKPETIFVIRGDRDTNYADITSVLDSLKAAGARHVSLAAESGKR